MPYQKPKLPPDSQVNQRTQRLNAELSRLVQENERLLAENERLKERAHILCEAADNISQPDYVQHAIEMMREELAAIGSEER